MNGFEYKDKLIASKKSKKGLRARIDAKCIECIYDPADVGTWVHQVSECECSDCPLHDVRRMK